MEPMLLGFGEAADLAKEIDGFLLRTGKNPSSTQVAEFLRLYSPGDARNTTAKALIASGVSANAVSSALNFLDASGNWDFRKIGGVLALVSAAASGFHGYRRNNSIGWGVVWFMLGGIFPVVAPVIAVAQGFGRPKKAA